MIFTIICSAVELLILIGVDLFLLYHTAVESLNLTGQNVTYYFHRTAWHFCFYGYSSYTGTCIGCIDFYFYFFVRRHFFNVYGISLGCKRFLTGIV